MTTTLEQDEEDNDDEAVNRHQETSNSSSTIKGPNGMVVVTNSVQLRLLDLDVSCEWNVHWVDLESDLTLRPLTAPVSSASAVAQTKAIWSF